MAPRPRLSGIPRHLRCACVDLGAAATAGDQASSFSHRSDVWLARYDSSCNPCKTDCTASTTSIIGCIASLTARRHDGLRILHGRPESGVFLRRSECLSSHVAARNGENSSRLARRSTRGLVRAPPAPARPHPADASLTSHPLHRQECPRELPIPDKEPRGGASTVRRSRLWRSTGRGTRQHRNSSTRTAAVEGEILMVDPAGVRG